MIVSRLAVGRVIAPQDGQPGVSVICGSINSHSIEGFAGAIDVKGLAVERVAPLKKSHYKTHNHRTL